MKLLIADDNPLNRKLLRAQLEAEQHAVIAVANGAEALKALQREDFDGLISDVLMPEMDGFRLCHEIRRDARLKTLPLVLYTATYTSPSDRALAKEIGADAFIAKPATTAEIIAALRAATHVGETQRASKALSSEAQILKRYSATLVRKLEQKNVELGDAHEQLRDLFDSTHDLVQATAEDGSFLYVNRAWHELLGYGISEISGLRIHDVVAAGSRAAWAQLFERLSRGQPVGNVELELRARDGRTIPVEGSATSKIVDGQLVAVRCTWRDISERHAAAAARQHLAAIVESSADAIIGKDLDGIVTSWNSSAERIFGYTAQEMIGAPISRLIPDDRQQEENTILARLRRGERVDHFESVRRRKDGRPIYVALTISPVRDRSGALVGISKIARDVTLHKAAEAARRATEERLAGVVRASMDAIVTIDGDQNISEFNPAAERMFGWPRDEAIGRPLATLMPERLAAIHGRHVEGFARDGVTSRQMGALLELVGIRRDGVEFPVEVSISQMEMTDGHYYTAVVRDITVRRKHEERIARLSRIQAVLSGINSAIVRIREPQALFDEACRIAHEDGGFGIAWIGTHDKETGVVTPVAWRALDAALTLNKASSRGDVPEGQGLVGRAIRARKPVFTNDLPADAWAGGPRRADALARGLHSLIVLPLIVDDEVAGVLALFAKGKDFFSDEELRLLVELAGDISFALSYTEKERQAAYLAYYDVLTGLPNRALFLDRLGQALRAAKQSGTLVAVAVGDIDRLRQINEVHGRQAGDAVLRELGVRVRTLSPEPDNSARVGSDEFAAVLTDVQSATEVAHRMESSMAAVAQSSFDIGGSALRITMSGGIAIAPQDGDTAEQILHNAETALANAKKAGLPYMFYQSDMTTRTAEMLAIESRLGGALALEQFELHYQPVLETRSGKVAGLEALLRWNDPDRGLVPPAAFIPTLEASGMIVDVGAWVIRRALTQARQWRDEGIDPPRIAVNVSPRQLQQARFVDDVARILEEFGTAAPRLDFEITEGTIMADFEATAAKLAALQKMGIEMAIDDFGTGYSSLAYLGRLPVDALKIDRSFISSMMSAADSMTIVSTIISLGHAMNLKVIAEGVETEEEAKMLRLLNCEQVQGYFYSKPVPADKARDFLRSHPRLA